MKPQKNRNHQSGISKQKNAKSHSRLFWAHQGVARILVIALTIYLAASPLEALAILYSPGATLNPGCGPTDINCGVIPPAASGANTDITSLGGLTTALSLSQGGTGGTTFTTNGLLYGNGAGALQVTSAPSAGNILIGNAGGVPAFVTLSGDGTLSGTGIFTLGTSGVTAASYGSSTQVPTFTVDAKGRLTAASTTPVSGFAIAGDVSGTLAASSVDKLKGTALNITSLATNNLLQYNGTNWINVTPTSLGSITLSTGTSGSDVNVSGSPASLGGTLTLNIPDASASARGLVTTGTQTLAGNKTLSGTTTLSNAPTITPFSTAGIVHNNSSGVLSSSLIVNADVSSSAAIAYSKLNLSGSIVNGDITDGTIQNAKLANSTIGLTLGTSGSDVNVSGSPASLGGALTLNVPDASATARGLVTTGTQTFAGAKTFNTDTTFNGNVTQSGSGTFATASGTNTLGGNVTLNGTTVTGAGASLTLASAAGTGMTVNSGTTGALALDSGTTGAINIGTGANAKTITIGNNTTTTGLTLTSGTTSIVASSTTVSGTGLALTTASADTGTAASITAAALTSGKGLLIAGPTTGSTFTGNLLALTSASTGNLGTATGSGAFNLNLTAAHTGSGFQIDDVLTGSATTDAAVAINVNSLTAGTGLAVIGTGTGVTGNMLLVQSASTSTATNGLARFNFTGAHAGSGVQIDDVTTAGNAMTINATGLTTGAAGNGLVINANNMLGATGSALLVSSTSAYTGTAGLLSVAGGSTTSGRVASINANALTSGIGLLVSGPSTANAATTLFTGNLGRFTYTKNYASVTGTESGNVMSITRNLNGSTATNTAGGVTVSGSVVNIQDNVTTQTGVTSSGNVVSMTSTNTGLTGSALLVQSNSTSAINNGLVRFNFTGAYNSGTGVQIDSAATAATTLQINANSFNTASSSAAAMVLDLDHFSGGMGFYIEDVVGTTSTGSLMQMDSISTSAVTNGLLYLNLSGAHTGNGMLIKDATATGTAEKIQVDALSSGNGLSISSTSTAAASNTQTLLNIALSGTNGTSAQTTYGGQISNTHAGTTSTNVGLKLSASGGTTANYALIVPGTGGNVGIGTSTPVTTLDVENTGATASTASANIILGVRSAGADASTVARFENAGAATCDVQPGGAGFACTSDGRLKKNYQNISNALDIVNMIHGITYDWAGTKNGKKNYGFIAQEVEKIAPELVSTDPVSGLKEMGYQNLTPILVNAVKDLNTKVDAQGLQIDKVGESIGLSRDDLDKLKSDYIAGIKVQNDEKFAELSTQWNAMRQEYQGQKDSKISENKIVEAQVDSQYLQAVQTSQSALQASIANQSLAIEDLKKTVNDSNKLATTNLITTNTSADSLASTLANHDQRLQTIEDEIAKFNFTSQGGLTTQTLDSFAKQGAITIESNVNFYGQLYASNDTIGTAIIKAGQNKINVGFQHPYRTIPKVVLTPNSDTTGIAYWVSAKSESGFTITIKPGSGIDVVFDWMALAPLKNSAPQVSAPGVIPVTTPTPDPVSDPAPVTDPTVTTSSDEPGTPAPVPDAPETQEVTPDLTPISPETQVTTSDQAPTQESVQTSSPVTEPNSTQISTP